MASPRIAIFSPLPPSPTGVADYTAELLPFLGMHFGAIDVYVDDGSVERPLRASRYRVLPQRLFEEVDRKARYDGVLYHHGNNLQHEYIYRQSLRRRGIALLHDALLHHFIATTTIPRGKFGLYAAELRYADGAAGERIATSRAHGLLADWHQFLVPLFDRVVVHSQAVIVHSAHAERAIRDRFPSHLIRRIPHHFSPPPPDVDRLTPGEARQRLGLPADAFLVGSFGFVTPTKRLEVALEAFARFRSRHPSSLYCVVGELSVFDRAVVDRLGIAPSVRFTGRVELPEFQTWLAAVDAVINLRYPGAGESSGSLVRALGAGKPTVVSKMPYCADYPLDLTLQVPVGEGEVEGIAAALERLKGNPGFAAELGAAARAHVRVRCTLEGSAAAQAEVVRQCMERRLKLN